MWPKEKTAFLVVHGNGPHRQYQTLNQFASNFHDWLRNYYKDGLRYEHKIDDKAKSYIRFKLSDNPYYIDSYEYYWDCYMVHDITLKELRNWVREFDDGVDKRDKQSLEGYNPPLIRLFRGRFPGLRVLIRLLTFVPGTKPILNWFTGVATDTVIYCLHDQRSSYYEIRQKVLSGAVEELKDLLNSSENYQQIIVVSHSLGTVIAHEAFNRLARELPVPKLSLGRFKGWVTLGPFLDVVAFFLQEKGEMKKKKPGQIDMEKLIKDHRHAFKGSAASVPGNPIDYTSLKVKWLNLYHPEDYVSNCPLIAYELDAKDVQLECDWELKAGFPKSLLYKIPLVKLFIKSVDAHSTYWENPKMYEEIVNRFF